MRLLLATAVVGLGLVLTTPAFAEPSADDRALARSLFDQGRNLMKEGNFGEACPKLEESQRLESGVGTLFNLADCYEHQGRFASAWAAFAEAADLAKRAGHEDREMVARDRASALVPKLSKMRVHMQKPLPPMLELRYDDKPLSPAILDNDMPVDPGDHRVRASATGKVSAEVTVHIDQGGAVAQVDIPTLADAPAAPVGPAGPPAGADAPPAEGGSSWQKPVAIGAGVGALIALGVGAVFGLKASSSWSDAQKACPNSRCSNDGYTKWEDSRSAGNVSTVGFVAGGILAAAAIVLFVTAPSSEKSAPASAPAPVAGASLGARTTAAGGPHPQSPLWRMP